MDEATNDGLIQALRKYREEFLAVISTAILFTIIGDTVMEALTERNFWTWPAVVWRIFLLLIASGVLYWGTSIVAAWLERRKEVPDPDKFTGWDANVPPVRALIAFVSRPNQFNESAGRSHEHAMNYHLETRGDAPARLSLVFLIVSAESRDRAESFRNTTLRDQNLQTEVLIYSEDVDFVDLPGVYEVVNYLIAEATSLLGADVAGTDVAIDVTGGTAVTSIAATLAGRERGVTLEYQEARDEDGNISWEPEHVTMRRLEFERPASE